MTTPIWPGDEPMTIPQLLFSLRGRLPRKAWWLWGVLAMLGAAAFLYALAGIATGGDPRLNNLIDLLLLWPAVAVSVKRWHDRGKSGWWVLINLVPVIGSIWVLVENGLLRGTVGANRYGDDLTGRF